MKSKTWIFGAALATALGFAVAPAEAISVDFETAPVDGVYLVRDSGAGTAALSTDYAVSATHSAKLNLPDPTSAANDGPNVKVWYTGKLGNTAGSFDALVTGGSSSSLPAPYMMFGVDVDGDGSLTTIDTTHDAFVIAFINPVFSDGVWFTTGLDANTKVHVVGDRAGLTNGTFSSSGTQDTLGALSGILTGNGSQTWGDLNVLNEYVEVGSWPGLTGSYTAYIDNISVAAVPLPKAAYAGLGLIAGIGLLGGLKRRQRRLA
jgi:hypothetical protein